jgi:DNA-binding transcriptional ArsR family regulator
VDVLIQEQAEACVLQHVDHEKVRRATGTMPSPGRLQDLAETYKVLSHPTRLKIVHALLSEDELCVCDLAAVLGMSVSSVSHQLRTMRGMRLVRTRREGKLVYYALDDGHVRMLYEAGLEHVREQGEARREKQEEERNPESRSIPGEESGTEPVNSAMPLPDRRLT